MKKKSGVIYQTEREGEYGVALYADQQEVFTKNGKLLLHIYSDPQCLVKKLRIDKRQFNSIESIDKLKKVGYSD